MMNLSYVKGDCLFTRINNVPTQYPYLTADIKTDVTVIGGGISGAIVGYYFAKNGIKTVLIDKSRIGHGSTSISTALLQYELDSNLAQLMPYTTQENVLKSYSLGLTALAEIERFAQETGNTFDYNKASSVLFTARQSEKQEIFNEYDVRRKAGLDVAYVENSAFGFDIKAALVSRNAAAKVDPYRLTHAMLNAGQQYGLTVYENTRAASLAYGSDGVTVTTEYGYVIQSHIVIAATGYDISLFTKRNLGATMGTTFNIATKPVPDLDPIYDRFIFRDNANPYHYFRTTKDKRIIMGGNDIGFLPEINNDALCSRQCDDLEQFLKQLFHNIEIEYRYYGAYATTSDNLGLIGKDPDHDTLWYCLGYGGNGILFSILGGMMLSKLYKGETPDALSLFNVSRYC